MDFIVFIIVLAVFAAFLIKKAVYIVKQAEVIVIERLGKYDRTLQSGINTIIPFLETPRSISWTVMVRRGKDYFSVVRDFYRIDLRETVYDFPSQNVITKDNVTIEINGLLYYQITDPKRAVYEINNVPNAIEKLTQTTLRNLIGELDLDETLSSRDTINRKLRLILDEATDKWGVKVNRVEVQDITPPEDIRSAMEKQMRAERARRATILEAEGKKRAQILSAEGEMESRIKIAEGHKKSLVLTAEGEAEARIKRYQAESKSAMLIQQAVKSSESKVDPLQYLITINYLKQFGEMATTSKDKVVFLPYEASGVLSSLGGIKEIFQNLKSPPDKDAPETARKENSGEQDDKTRQSGYKD